MPANLTPDQAKEVLKTFNSKLDKILGFSFFKHPKFSLSVQHNFATHTATVDSDYPDDEAIDAVILSLRFFILQGEFTSYHRLQSVYAALSPTCEVQAAFDVAYGRWTTWNQAPSGIVGTTNERLFEIIFYGERAHRNNPANYLEYDAWKQQILLFEAAMVTFCHKIDELVKILRPIYDLNQRMLV